MIASILGWLASNILPGLLGNLADDVVTGLFNLLQGEMQKRNLLEQGREQQHAADLEATVKEAQNARKVDEHVAAESDAQLDADLERVRRDAAASH